MLYIFLNPTAFLLIFIDSAESRIHLSLYLVYFSSQNPGGRPFVRLPTQRTLSIYRIYVLLQIVCTYIHREGLRPPPPYCTPKINSQIYCNVYQTTWTTIGSCIVVREKAQGTPALIGLGNKRRTLNTAALEYRRSLYLYIHRNTNIKHHGSCTYSEDVQVDDQLAAIHIKGEMFTCIFYAINCNTPKM